MDGNYCNWSLKHLGKHHLGQYINLIVTVSEYFTDVEEVLIMVELKPKLSRHDILLSPTIAW